MGRKPVRLGNDTGRDAAFPIPGMPSVGSRQPTRQRRPCLVCSRTPRKRSERCRRDLRIGVGAEQVLGPTGHPQSEQPAALKGIRAYEFG